MVPLPGLVSYRVRFGLAGHGKAEQGVARNYRARLGWARHGTARHGGAWDYRAWHGKVRWGEAWLGMELQGVVR